VEGPGAIAPGPGGRGLQHQVPAWPALFRTAACCGRCGDRGFVTGIPPFLADGTAAPARQLRPTAGDPMGAADLPFFLRCFFVPVPSRRVSEPCSPTGPGTVELPHGR